MGQKCIWIELWHSHLLQRSVMVLLRQKVNVPGRHYSNQLAAHFARFCHGDPRETVSHFGFKYIPHRVARTHHHWVCDEALLEFLSRANSFEWDTQTSLKKKKKTIIILPRRSYLDLANFIGLKFSCTVVMNYSNPAHQLEREPRKIRNLFWTFETVTCLCGKSSELMEKTDAAMFVWVLVLTAMAMAMEDSVTVSMGDEMRGVFRVIFLVNADVRSSNLYAFGKRTRQDLWP